MASKKMVVVDSGKIEWETVERALERLGHGGDLARAPEVVKRALIKVLRIDEETGAITGIVKFDRGFHIPKHTHPSDENSMVLEGKLVNEKGNEIKKGMYVFTPAGVEHAVDAPENCVLFVHFNGPAW